MIAGLWKAWSTMAGQASRLRKIETALATRVGPSRAAIVFEVAINPIFLIEPIQT
jgi:hypothetical protein